MTTEMPLVSVVICAYNAQDFIEETLQSVLAHTYPRVQLIVVDDGSKDETAAIVRSHGARVHLISHENRGLASARNSGIAQCAGEYLVFFDADDLMPPERIALQVDYMQRHPDIALSFVDYRNFNSEGQAERTHFQTCPRLQQLLAGRTDVTIDKPCEALLEEYFGISGTMMVRRSILSQVSGFDPELRGSEDLNFAYRVARHTRVAAIDCVGMLRRLHGSNLSSHAPTMLPAIVNNYTKLYLTESDGHARRLLKQRLAMAWSDQGRYEADRKHLLRALACEVRAVRSNFEPAAVWKLGRNTCRALAVFAGLHVPAGK